MSNTNKTQEQINNALRATHVKLPQKSSTEWVSFLKKKVKGDEPAPTDPRNICGNGVLMNTYAEQRLAHHSHVALNAIVPDVTVTADHAMISKIGKLGVLATDLHDSIFPCYVRAHVAPLEVMDDYAEFSDTGLVLMRNCAMTWDPDPSGVYGAGVEAFDFLQFQRDMKYLGRSVDLNRLPIGCPINEPKAFHAWFTAARLSSTSDTLFTETNDSTDISDYYASHSIYKSFQFRGGSPDNPHSEIAFAGCTWTITRPTREWPAVLLSVCRFDPIAYFFADRADIIEKYVDIRTKRSAGQDPVPVEQSTYAYTHGANAETLEPLGLSEESLAAAEERLRAAGALSERGFSAGLTIESAKELEDEAQREAMKVMVSSTLNDFLG